MQINPRLLIGNLQSRTARIARLKKTRKSLRKRFLRIDTSVSALSRNTPMNSIVQAIHGREVGLKEPHTADLYDCLSIHNIFLSFDYYEWRVRNFCVTEFNPGCNADKNKG